MFTGIIEATGKVLSIQSNGSNKSFVIESAISNQLKIDQSVSHNGVCLTVESIENSNYALTAIEETLLKTNLNDWEPGTLVNLERCLKADGRLDGHIVQGHVDTVGQCVGRVEKQGSVEFTIAFPEQFSGLVIEKGSIALNGISLTLFNVGLNQFTVAIIPYTLENTNLNQLRVGNSVNIEFDMVGKYILRNSLLKGKV